MATAPPPVQLTDLFAKLRRHWLVVAAGAVIGLVLGIAASFAIPASYTAQSTVAVNPMSSNLLEASSSTASVNMPTEKQVVMSRTVAAAASKRLQPTYSLSAKKVQGSTSVTIPEDSLILGISFSAATPEQAAAGADAVAEAYLANRRQTATSEFERRSTTAEKQLTSLQGKAAGASSIESRTIAIQVEALANQLAQLGNVDLNPGQVIGKAEPPAGASNPGALPLGVAGGFLGLLLGVPVALTRREESTEIGSVEGLSSVGDQIVLDGTTDSNRTETWDVAAFMLKIPENLSDTAFVVLVDADDDADRTISPGQELVDALSRRGRAAQLVDVSGIDHDTINRGWPTDQTLSSWAGEVVVIDTTGVMSDPVKVALAGRAGAVVLARTTTDDASALRRFTALMKAKNVEPTLTALFPPRPELSLR